ncbi:hypothetical protein ACFVTE_14290 [Arthrobacter sp. NPDC058097]|uniref:hypothetical protein n=1 Tax=Arthrobacter sp. NPDC058097 TaxID=3346340 RepID=UPI0036DECC49
MPITRNVAWDAGLESFKGADTREYALLAAKLARHCGTCRGALGSGEPVSLCVDIMRSAAPDGTECLTFTDCVCHRSCKQPALTVHEAPWTQAELKPVAARVLFVQQCDTGRIRVLPILAFTLNPVLTFRENGGELTSALVSLLLAHRFELAVSPDCSALLQQADVAEADCGITITPWSQLLLNVGGENLYREQLDPHSDDDTAWIQAATRTGRILVISGDYLDITDTGIDLDTAARRGALVIGAVPVIVGCTTCPSQMGKA